MGMDVSKFSECLMSNKKLKIVNEDAALGSSMGVPGTPTFYVGNKQIVGIPKFSELKEIIDAQLKELEDGKEE